MVMHDDEFKTKGNKIWTKDIIEPQHLRQDCRIFGWHTIATELKAFKVTPTLFI